MCYTADGKSVLAGGRSKFLCIYAVESKMLLRRYQLSHNRSLDAVLDKLHSGAVREGGTLADIDVDDSDDSDSRHK